VLDDVGLFTPYSTIKPLIGEDLGQWAPELDRDRIAAYQKYDEIYWSHTDAFKLTQRGDDDRPIYVPNPKMIVDTTSHFFMKGLKFTTETEGELNDALDEFLKRELFVAKFHEAKHSGVARGDFLLHLTADPTKPQGSRLSVNSVDPAAYFPEFDDDDLDRITAVNLVEQILDPDDPIDPNKVRIRRQRYEVIIVSGKRRVLSELAIYEVRDWWKRSRVKVKEVMPPKLLPEGIEQIPVYAFKNISWQGQPFGSSEIRGYERLQAGINQSISDEELALALEGLGVYATDAGAPVDEEGNEVPWEIAPGKVLELPGGGSYFSRVKGIESVEPSQSHIEFLVNSLYETSGTFRSGLVDAQVAESGIALAIRFLPTSAKLEERDEFGVGRLDQFWFDWRRWNAAYEGRTFDDSEEIKVILGDKLPENKTDALNVLNNLMDRKAISKKFYRESVSELYGITIPDDIEAQMAKEAQEAFEAAQKTAALTNPPPGGNQSNNRSRPNESGGTEATNKDKEA
jgi:hypothetical protein